MKQQLSSCRLFVHRLYPYSISIYQSYLSLLGVTPLISQDERSSVMAHASTPSASMTIALEHRSRVKRTSFKFRDDREVITPAGGDGSVCIAAWHSVLQDLF